MAGAPIDALNEGLATFKSEVYQDEIAALRVEVAIVTFGPVQLTQDFVTIDNFTSPRLVADGVTPMGEAIEYSLDLLEQRKVTYKNNGVQYYRPWVFLITDGEPQGEPDSLIEQAAQRIKEDEDNKRVAFFAVGVEGANITRLSQIVTRSPLKLVGLNFQEMFIWLSASMQRVSQSRMDEQIPLPPPGWGII